MVVSPGSMLLEGSSTDYLLIRHALLLNERALAATVWSPVRARRQAYHCWRLREYGVLWDDCRRLRYCLLLPESWLRAVAASRIHGNGVSARKLQSIELTRNRPLRLHSSALWRASTSTTKSRLSSQSSFSRPLSRRLSSCRTFLLNRAVWMCPEY